METLEEYIEALETERILLMQQFAIGWCSALDEYGNYTDDRMRRIVELETLLHPDCLAEWFAARRRLILDEIIDDLDNER